MRFRQVDGSTSHFSLQLPSRDRLDRPLGPGVSVLTGYRNAPMSASGHIATFHCAAEFGRYRGMADIGRAAPVDLDLSVRAQAQTRRTIAGVRFFSDGAPSCAIAL